MAVREQRAKQLAALTGTFVLALAVGVALVQERAADDAAPHSPRAPDAPGRAVYDAHGCRGCHSLGGIGNPRAPLDEVGDRLTPRQIEAWMVADGTVAGSLPASVRATKAAYRELPEPERAALVAWLARQRRQE